MPGSKSSSKTADDHLFVTILAGGVGSRFWPLSTPEHPKQLLALAGDRPLVVETVERAGELVSAGDRIRILTGERLVGPLREALPDLPDGALAVEPRARGTGPVLAWAAWSLRQRDPEAVIVSLHADHVIEPRERFVEVVSHAAGTARDHDVLVTVAVRPDRPEVGYGYIQPGEELPGSGSRRAFRVAAFHEKPDRATAERYLDEGYLWNSGIFVWTADAFLREVRSRAPEIGDRLDLLEDGEVERFFEEVPTISVDEGVLERSDRVAAVEADFRWDDVGNWEALSRIRAGDGSGNVTDGPVHVVDGERNVVHTGDRPVVLFGVSDLVVVRTPDATLVTTRSRAPDLKELLRRLPPDLRDP